MGATRGGAPGPSDRALRRPVAALGPAITITESVLVRRPPETVWDYTQDYARRAEWDPSVLVATVLAREPVPRVRVHRAMDRARRALEQQA